jgi:hypothetical protein
MLGAYATQHFTFQAIWNQVCRPSKSVPEARPDLIPARYGWEPYDRTAYDRGEESEDSDEDL